jgi:alpha-tubulin suppressor-like RCC1 family protein
MSIKIKGNTVIYDNGNVRVAANTTENRPVSIKTGMLRYNTTRGVFETTVDNSWRPLPEHPLPERKIFGWGRNDCFQLGDGTNTCQRSSPVSVIGDYNWCSVGAAEAVTFGITTGNQLFSWGRGSSGNNGLEASGGGTGYRAPRPIPASITYTDPARTCNITCWSSVKGSSTTAMALGKASGTYNCFRLFSWGRGSFNLGRGTSYSFNNPQPSPVLECFNFGGQFCCFPVSFSDGTTNFSVGPGHSGFIRCNTLAAWGCNDSGQLGTGDTTNRCFPTFAVSCVCRVAFGLRHSLALRLTGVVVTAGNNNSGQLGDGTTTSRCFFGNNYSGRALCISNVCQISAANYQSFAVTASGILWAWGRNTYGELGDGTTTSRSSPVSVIGGFTNWCQVAAARNSTAAIRANGTLWTWGRNNLAQLGDNTTTNRSSPVSVVGGITSWARIEASNGYSTHFAATTFQIK